MVLDVLDEIALMYVRMRVLGPVVAVGVLVLGVVVVVLGVRVGVRVPVMVMWVDVRFGVGVRCAHALLPFVFRSAAATPSGRTAASLR